MLLKSLVVGDPGRYVRQNWNSCALQCVNLINYYLSLSRSQKADSEKQMAVQETYYTKKGPKEQAVRVQTGGANSSREIGKWGNVRASDINDCPGGTERAGALRPLQVSRYQKHKRAEAEGPTV